MPLFDRHQLVRPTCVGLEFPGKVHRPFQLEPFNGRNADNLVYLLYRLPNEKTNKQQMMDSYETVIKPGQLNPDTMKANYSTGRLGATTRRAGKGCIKTSQI